MKKSDVKGLISAIGKEKRAFFFSDAEYTWVSNGYFAFKTRDKEIAQYIIDTVNERKRKPEWQEMERLKDIVEDYPDAHLCADVQTGKAYGREVLILNQSEYSVWINEKFVIPKTNFYTMGTLKPVYQFVGSMEYPEAIHMILPIKIEGRSDD